MDNIASYIIRIGVQNKKEVDDLSARTNKLHNRVNATSSAFNRLFKMAAGAFSVYKIAGYVKMSTAAYNDQAVAETRLAQVMRNTMGAADDEMKSIIRLASAQERLGVISAAIQTAGAQELGTYLTKRESLEQLLPVMNDMLAQQYGLNASQEQAVTIASMLGKVMDGQVGALSRYGYRFDEAQENILKYGNEAQRVATLADVVTGSVGGMNKALAQTPEGQLKQTENVLGSIGVRVGKLWTLIKTAWIPVREFFSNSMGNLLAKLEESQDKIISGVQTVAAIVINVFKGVGSVIGWVVGVWNWFVEGVRSGNPYFQMAATVLKAIVGVIVVYKSAMLLVTAATKIWAGVQSVLNAVMMLNPIGIVVGLILILIGTIMYVAATTEGWGETWNNTMEWMRLGLEVFNESVSLIWLQIKDTFISGFEIIAKGWYKLKSLWDKEGAREGLALLEQQRNSRAEEIAAARGRRDEARQQMRDMNVWAVKSNGKGLGDIVGGLKSKLGISTPMAFAGSSAGGLGTGSGTADTTEAIVTGGSKSTNITINIGNMVETMNFTNSDKEQNMQKMRDDVLDMLLRVLNMAQATS